MARSATVYHLNRGKRQAATARRTLRKGASIQAELVATLFVLGETALAAQDVITLRLARLAEAATDPRVLTDPEFQRMGQEKVEAATEAGFALAEGWRDIQDCVWDWGSRQLAANERAAMGLVQVRTPQDLAWLLTRHMDASLDAAQAATARLALAASRLANLGLAPIHRTASANARRLTDAARKAA